MKQLLKQISFLAFAAILLAPVSLMAQNDEKDQEMKEKKEMKEDKEMKEKKDVQVITITRKGDKDEKMTVEINGDKVTVNGKPIEDLKDSDITVRLHKMKDMRAFGGGSRNGVWNFNNNDAMSMFNGDENHAMLGVTTEKADQGVVIQDITKESAAEKAGLKEKDIITKIDDQKIENPDELSKAIGSHKPGDKVKVTYLRDNKEETVTTELTKWKGVDANAFSYNFKMPEMNYNEIMPKIQGIPRGDLGQLWNINRDRPRLGLSVQDTEDGKGVKVLDVDDEGNASKAGIKEDDVITAIDGKAVNSADEVAKIVRESKDKNSLMLKIQRGGKTQNIEVKIPRKLKTADL